MSSGVESAQQIMINSVERKHSCKSRGSGSDNVISALYMVSMLLIWPRGMI